MILKGSKEWVNFFGMILCPKLGYVNTVLDKFFVRPKNFTGQFVHTEMVKYLSLLTRGKLANQFEF